MTKSIEKINAGNIDDNVVKTGDLIYKNGDNFWSYCSENSVNTGVYLGPGLVQILPNSKNQKMKK